jgi:hypothetical protein
MSQWTHEKIRGLGATTDLPTLGSIFGVSRWRAYQMAHTREWEQIGIRIVPVGTKYRVVVQSILEVLGNSDPSAPGRRPVPPGLESRCSGPVGRHQADEHPRTAPSRAMGRIQEKK